MTEKEKAKAYERAWLYLISDVLTWKDGIGQYLDDPRVQELAKRLCSKYVQKLYNPAVLLNFSNTVKCDQKSVDKIEPKFHKGDWIIIDKPCQIINIHDNGNYIVQYCDDEKTHEISKNFCESYFHFWTIQDAKDGDILAYKDEILLFKSYSVLQGCISLYCWYNGHTNNFHSKEVIDILMTTRNKMYPATKEQRDALMKAMNDAGYEWDTEKKELKRNVKVQ